MTPPGTFQPAERTILSPCKINLFLDVIGRRPDGYHEVVTVIEPLALCDRLVFRTTREKIEVAADDPEVPDGEENIVCRAARLLRESAGTYGGVSIRIEKNVPSAAGLGGGSADAAAALRTLNDLWDLGLSLPDLTALAGKLGSDVPFFLQPRTSLWRGRGEKGEPLPEAPPFFAVVINPAFPLSTRRAYSELAVSGPARLPHPNLAGVTDALKRSDLAALGKALYNRFQETLAPRYPRIQELLDFFREREALGALLSGSGPTVIGLAAEKERAEQLAADARAAFPETYRIVVAANLPSPPPTGDKF
ncbi:MAG: 4-(cytidine 5'-diphospho)-2-C-methyl-D-erythritol kinase [Candidatus Erginobacter occultus]|nr:4-(cytidine 5'-diphospho)-2-C-methyl-D-erythritol kinase [Candidatus Erginobacter occultus]